VCYKGQIPELPAILDSFYTTITNDHIGMEVRAAQKWWVFPCVEVDTARRSRLRSNRALNITNSSQFDGQALWPIVWQFSTGWVLVYSHHCHLNTTRALKHIT